MNHSPRTTSSVETSTVAPGSNSPADKTVSRRTNFEQLTRRSKFDDRAVIKSDTKVGAGRIDFDETHAITDASGENRTESRRSRRAGWSEFSYSEVWGVI